MPFKSNEVAYAAGLFEGEGSVCRRFGTYRKRNGEAAARKSPQFTLGIGMTDREPLEKFQQTFGLGYVNGPYEPHDGNKPYWRYDVRGFERVQAVLAAIWPYLSPRRQSQAVAALKGA